MKLKINIFFLHILIIFFATSASTVFSQIVGPHLTYEKADGTIIKIALKDLESITIDSLSCYDRMAIFMKNDSIYNYDFLYFTHLSYDDVKNIVKINMSFKPEHGEIIRYSNSFDVSIIDSIKFYKYFDHLYHGKRLTGATITLTGLIFETTYYSSVQAKQRITQDSSGTSKPFIATLRHPSDCYSASITDTSVSFDYTYNKKNLPDETRDTQILKISLDTINKHIKLLDILVDHYKKSVTGSHVSESGSRQIIQIQNIPYTHTKDGFIEIKDVEIPYENMLKVEYKSEASSWYGGGSSFSGILETAINSENGKFKISCVFEWKQK